MNNLILKFITLISIQLFVSSSVIAATCMQTVPDSALVKKGTLVMSTNPVLCDKPVSPVIQGKPIVANINDLSLYLP